jgi:hypothetical protein
MESALTTIWLLGVACGMGFSAALILLFGE